MVQRRRFITPNIKQDFNYFEQLSQKISKHFILCPQMTTEGHGSSRSHDVISMQSEAGDHQKPRMTTNHFLAVCD